MKFRITGEDLENFKRKYSDESADAAFAEEYRWFGLPKYYVVILDNEKLTLIEMSLGLSEKSHTAVPLSEVKSVLISGMIQKRVRIETNSQKIDLVFKPLAVGKGHEQKDFLERIAGL